MENYIVRLREIELFCFKNVTHGVIQLQKPLDRDRDLLTADIVGIYGQNGSGKTALIDALQFLQMALLGEALPKQSEDYIQKGQKQAKLHFTFSLEWEDQSFLLHYSFSLAKEEGKIVFVEECLAYSPLQEGKNRRTIIQYDQTNDDILFTPIYQYEKLVKGNPQNAVNLAVAKKMAKLNATSFIFGSEGFKIFIGTSSDLEYRGILQALREFADLYLFVIHNKNSSLISSNFILPFVFKLENDVSVSKGTVGIELGQAGVVRKEVFEIVSSIIRQMNVVLTALIPGFTVRIRDYGPQSTEQGEEGIKIELMSVRNEQEIPLRCESEGIKKIMSILNSLIAMYHDRRICVVIDELDAGIYEYLLGEILAILEKYGQGQLIFTSHNLRPLEKLKAASILFTTTNPQNRYIRFANVKSTNNLRGLYLRSIHLGGQKECLYSETDIYEIQRAFRFAGKVDV